MEASSQAKGPSEALLHYDMGDALYKQERYDEAAKEFEQAQSSTDLKLREKAYYNSGNCSFRTGIAKKDIEMLKKAAASYQKALEIDPNDQDAKHNLEVVRRHIQLQNKQQEPQPQPQQQQGQQQKQEQGKDQKDQNQTEPESAKPAAGAKGKGAVETE